MSPTLADEIVPLVCERCGKNWNEVDQMDRHHTSYKRDEWIGLCQRCHTIVHENPEYFEEWMPETSRKEAKARGYNIN